MSAFVTTDNNICSVVDLLAKYEPVENNTELAKRLYLLNVESVNQRYDLKDSDRESDRAEYARYLKHAEEFEYFEQPDRDSVAIHIAAGCWIYQSCEGDCDQQPLFNIVCVKSRLHAMDTAKELTGRDDIYDAKEAEHIIYAYHHKDENIRKYENIWD